MSEITFGVAGMSCQKCVGNVEAALRAVAGVGAVTVSLEKALATVEYDPELVQPAALYATVEALGFDLV